MILYFFSLKCFIRVSLSLTAETNKAKFDKEVDTFARL